MKKVISSFLAMSLMACLLVGCSGSDAPQTSSADPGTSTSSSEVSAPETSDEPVYISEDAESLSGEVRFYTAFDGAAGTDALIAEFNEYYPNITVTPTTYKNSPDGNVGLDTAMMAGEVDVLLSFGVANTAQRWTNNLLMDLTDRLAADNLDLKTEWGTDVYKYNDKVYVFPSGGLSVYVAINMEKWEAAGLGDRPSGPMTNI